MREEKSSFMIGLAQKAGKVKSGEFAAEKAIKEGQAKLLILSEDASENTKKKFLNMAAWHHVPVRIHLPKAELGRIIGRGERSCVVITDENLGKTIAGLLKQTESSENLEDN